MPEKSAHCQTGEIKARLPVDRQIEAASDLFKILGDQTRLRLICALMLGELCVHELADIVEMSQSAVSHQLRILRQGHLVRYRRDGRHTWYSLSDEHVRQLVDSALMHVDEGYSPQVE